MNTPKTHGARLVTPGFGCLLLAYFFVFLNVAFFYLYPVILSARGSDPHTIGWIMGTFSISAVLSRPFIGKFAALKDEYGLMSAGTAMAFVSTLGYHVIEDVGPAMVVIRILHGLGFSSFIAGSFSLVAKKFPRAQRGQAYGLVGAAIMGAVALGPLVGENIMHQLGYHALYHAAAACLLLAWVSSRMVRTGSIPSRFPKKAKIRFHPILSDSSFLFLLISTLIFGHCQSTVFNFLALAASEKGTESGPFFFVSFLLAILILLTMGRIIDRLGKIPFLRAAYPLLSLGILLIPALILSRFSYFPALLFGAGVGFLFPCLNALASGHGSERDKPAVMALFTAVYDTGFITGGVISGMIAQWAGLDRLFFWMGLLALSGGIIGWLAPIKEN